tara:strand:- start:46 stop:672 length:627 start_codon:yes stop_codon:yes gene_type:complete
LNPLQRRVTDPTIEQLGDVIELIRTFDEPHGSNELSIHVIACFLYIASRDGAHKQALEEDLPFITRASSSRNTDWLSKWHRQLLPSGKRKPGLGLIKKEPDISDKRRSTLTLTKKGEELIEQVKQILYGEERTLLSKVEHKPANKTEEDLLNDRLERYAAVMPGATDKTQENSLNLGIVDELEKLIAMKEKGLLSDEEFTAAKAKLLK